MAKSPGKQETKWPDQGEGTLQPPSEGTRGLQVAAVERTDVGMQAVEAIKSLITSGDLQPGDTLPAERELAAMLGISRPSLREAIRVLRAMNIIETRHGDRTYVSSLEPHLLAQPIAFMLQVAPTSIGYLFETRLLLEADAVLLAATRITKEQIAEISALIEESAKQLDHVQRYMEVDHRIHTAIVEAAGNPILSSMYRSISELLLESRKRTAGSLAIRKRALREHGAIVEALESGDGTAAADQMRGHLNKVHALWQAAADEGLND